MVEATHQHGCGASACCGLASIYDPNNLIYDLDNRHYVHNVNDRYHVHIHDQHDVHIHDQHDVNNHHNVDIYDDDCSANDRTTDHCSANDGTSDDGSADNGTSDDGSADNTKGEMIARSGQCWPSNQVGARPSRD